VNAFFRLGLMGSGGLVVVLVACALLGLLALPFVVVGSFSLPSVSSVDLPGIHVQGNNSGGDGMIAAVLSLCIPLVALLGVIFLVALWLLKGNSKGQSKETNADEARMIQEIYHGLIKMEERVEALETLLLDKQGKGNR